MDKSMPTVNLMDYNLQLTFGSPIKVIDLIKSIKKNIVETSICGKIDTKLVDLNFVIKKNCSLKVLTVHDKEGLQILRHSCAHLLAHAVKSLFPSVQFAIGPTVENGFYYDFAFNRSFTDEDLIDIECQMMKIVKLMGMMGLWK